MKGKIFKPTTLLSENAKLKIEIVELKNTIKMHETKQLNILSVSGSAFLILNKGAIVENILFKSQDEAINYLKIKSPKRNFKEPEENVFVCKYYGTKFIIQEQYYR